MQKQNGTLFCFLHGFLGQPSDWEGVINHLNKKCINESTFFYVPQLGLDLPTESFEQLVKAIVERIQSQKTKMRRCVFVGYSLGGRAGLHILEQYPDLFDDWFFVSTHSGFVTDTDTDTDRQLRLQSDLEWKNKLLNLSWDEFLKQWNSQPVFSQTKSVERAVNLSADIYAQMLDQLSLARQKDFSEIIRKYQNRITWIVGEKDPKFLNLADNLKQKKILSSTERIPSSGHRIPFDEPVLLAEIILRQLAVD